MKIIFVFLLCCINIFSFAANLPLYYPTDDTCNVKKPYELDQAEFLDRYGRDDSSKALIHLFFHKRKISTANTAVGAPILVAGAIGIGVTSHTIDKGEGNWDTLGQALLFTMLLGAGIALVLVGISFGGKYSRKKLLRLLTRYFDGKHLPRGITKHKAFKSLVAAEH